MSTKILIENNKIVFEGHADDSETCRTLTAICDALSANENFSTIKYESGYAEFERVSGGDSLMFVTDEEYAALVDRVEELERYNEEMAAYVKTLAKTSDVNKTLADYLTRDDANKTYETIESALGRLQPLQDAIDQTNLTLGDVDTTRGTVAEQLNNMNILALETRNVAEAALSVAEGAKDKFADKDTVELMKGVITDIEGRIDTLEESSGSSEELDEIRSLVNTLETKVTAFESKASRTLPFTADEVIAKLNSIS